MDLRNSAAKPKTNSVPKGGNLNFYNSVRQQSLSRPGQLLDQPQATNQIRTSHPDQIFANSVQGGGKARRDQHDLVAVPVGNAPSPFVVTSVGNERSSRGPLPKTKKPVADESHRTKVIASLSSMETSNHQVRTSFSKIALSMNSLMAICLKIKKANDQPPKKGVPSGSLNGHLHDITSRVETLNTGINEVQYHLLESDDGMNRVREGV